MYSLLGMIMLGIGSLKSVFVAIQQMQFDKAEAQIEQAILEDDQLAIAYYAKSVLYTKDEFEKRNLDSAYLYIAQGVMAYKETPLKIKAKYDKKYAIRYSSYRRFKGYVEEKAFDELDLKDTLALKSYMDYYISSPFCNEANMRVLEIRYFSDMPQDAPPSFYAFLLENFPNNPKINEAWLKYYEKTTWDGQYATIAKFEQKYPNFPYKKLMEKELETAQFAEMHALVFPATNKIDYKRHIEYMKMASNKYQAVRVLQMYIKPETETGDFEGALEKLNGLDSVFAGNKYFEQLKKLLTEDTEKVEAVNVGPAINTDRLEHSPLLTADGNTMYFCGSKRQDNLGIEDVFMSVKKDGEWQQATLMPGINSENENEAPESISTDGNLMLLFKEGDIYYSRLTSSGWLRPKPFNDLNTNYWDGDAMFASNGKAVLFASEGRKNAHQNFAQRDRSDYFDIFVSLYDESGGWGEPINLGPVVNTSFCDRYPYLHHDMKTLYFSSSGHGGFGYTDVYMCKRLCDTSWTKWSEPVNLGRYINTASYDNGYKISPDGENAYFAVYKDKNFDIYSIPLPKEFRPEKSYVFNGVVELADKSPCEAKIRVENLETRDLVGIYTSSPVDGSFSMALPAGVNYGFFIDKEFYYPVSENIDLRTKADNEDIFYRFTLNSIKELIENNMTVKMNNVFFETNKYDLTPESYPELERIVGLFETYEAVKLSVEGHSDNTGEAGFNKNLSQKRAEAVVNYLVNRGCDSNRLSAVGFGDTKPVADNQTEAGKALNRRVELRFVK